MRLRTVVAVTMLLLARQANAQRGSRLADPDTSCIGWRRMVRDRGTAALRGNLDRAERCKLGDSTVEILWRTASADTAQLSLLLEATGYMGGAQALRVVVRTLGDRRRPTLVRLAALATM